MYSGRKRFLQTLLFTVVALVLMFQISRCVILALNHYQLQGSSQPASAELTGPTSPPDSVDSASGAHPEAEKIQADAAAAVLPYQKKYPDMYVDPPFDHFAEPVPGSIYLTFDDGPSKYTPQILQALNQYGVKATFFVVYRDDAASKELYRQMLANGHTLGIHSTTHNYRQIYQSVDAYLDDFAQTFYMLYDATGVKPSMFRFPGGSLNAYNSAIYQDIIAEMTRRGFLYYDWNVSSGDATAKSSQTSIINSVLNGIWGRNTAVVLFHDSATKADTAAVIPTLLTKIKAAGYHMEPLDTSVKPVHFVYPDPVK